jgi:phosphatidylinositol-4,5-bisphosphate 3-kinase
LAEFLLERAIANPVLIGHRFFWTLRAEMHITEISERYGLLIEEYLLGCGSHRSVLQKQNDALGAILEVAYYLKTVPKEDRLTQLRARLRKIELPDRFQLPLHPKFVAKGVVVDKCRYMDSAKLPLWCVFENADPNGAPLYTIVKAGDDLRQDLLCIQLLALMDRLWQREGLDLCMTPYGCVATGHDEGMLEIVLDADTTANISFEYGGAAAAFSKETISAWLKKHNPDETKYAAAVETFVRSAAGCDSSRTNDLAIACIRYVRACRVPWSAGPRMACRKAGLCFRYCVGTYILGLGDRHNDNIMVTKQGKFLHIDFGTT